MITGIFLRVLNQPIIHWHVLLILPNRTGLYQSSMQFLHTKRMLLINKSKRIRGTYNKTLKLYIEQMIRDIDILEKG